MKLGFGTKISYGIGASAENGLYTLISSYLIFFLTTIAGVEPAIAGTIAALGSVFEALAGPVFGYVSDRTETRFGKRKPFLLAGAVPIAVITSLLFTTFDVSAEFKTVYYLGLTLLFWVCFSSFFVPYLTWGSELTDDYEERTTLRSISFIFDQLGTAVGLVLPTVLVDYLVSVGMTLQSGWQAVGIIVGVFSGSMLLICAATNKVTDIKDFKPRKNKEKVFTLHTYLDIFKSYIQILKLRPMLYILGASLMFLLGDSIFMSDRIYFMSFNVGFTGSEITLSMVIITLFGVVVVPIIAFFSKLFDKKYVLVVGMITGGVLLLLLGFIGVDSFGMTIAACMVYSAGHTCYWQLMPSVNYDMCEVQEFYNKEKRAGAVVSLQALSESISMALGSQLLGIILSLSGFLSGALTQSESAQWGIGFSFTVLPAVFMIIAGLIMSRFPLNHEIHKKLLDALDKREKGESDTEEEDYLYKKLKLKKR